MLGLAVVMSTTGCKVKKVILNPEKATVDALATKGVVATVTCPEHIPATKGSKFVCRAVDSTGAKLVVNETVDDDSEGAITIELAGAVVDIEKLGARIREGINAPNSKTGDLQCAGKVIVVTATPTICKFVHEGTAHEVAIAEDDPVEHSYKFEIKDP
ncbi:MAG TPA: hypothetical protein VF403_10340 [Kofleriaceae bacterium]